MDTRQKTLRWAGRNGDKDALRASIWTKLEDAQVGIGDVWDSIPNFIGAELAAERLAQLPFWQAAKTVKVNPDAPQIPVRYRALRDGKRLYMPIPELAQDLPFLLLDPSTLESRGISFEEAATLEGALRVGQRVAFSEMVPMEVLVVGCVACAANGGRTGKGAGFADLEMGIFSELGLIPQNARIVTTVHSLQMVESQYLPIQSHDYPLDWLVTPDESVETNTQHIRPSGVQWSEVRQDQFNDIPFLKTLQAELQPRP